MHVHCTPSALPFVLTLPACALPILRETYDIVLGDNVRLGLVVPVPELTTEADVHLHTVAALVVVSRRGEGGYAWYCDGEDTGLSQTALL